MSFDSDQIKCKDGKSIFIVMEATSESHVYSAVSESAENICSILPVEGHLVRLFVR